ncbi:hypothetical protein GQ457_16G010150 [Hibiscus cannabinus]
MAENISSLLENLQFTELETMAIAETAGPGISLAGDVRYGLLGKLPSPRLASGNSVVREQQRSSIIRRSPWLFEGDPLVTIPFNPSLSLNEHDFSKILYWVRIHELPLNMMTMDIAATIGSRFETLIAVDTRHNLGNLGEFFRLRVEINVHNPLLRCVTVGKHADGRNRICPVQFEKLNKFCFNCGRLGHEIELCPQPKDVTATATPYGPWMRAPMDTRRPPPYQRRGIVYCEATTTSHPISQQVPAPITNVANPGDGISDTELVALDKVVDELGVNSSLFVNQVVVSNEGENCGKRPMQPMLQAGFETGSSSKVNDLSTVGQTDLLIVGFEPGTVAADPIQNKEKMVLDMGVDPGSLGKVNSLAGSSSILQDQELEHGTPVVVTTDDVPSLSHGDATMLVSIVTNPAVEPNAETPTAVGANMDLRTVVEPTVELRNAVEHTVTSRAAAQVIQPRKELTSGTTLTDDVIKKGSTSHRRRSLPLSESSKCDNDEAARVYKRSRHGKHRSSSSTKRSRSGTDLDDATKNKELGLAMAEAGEQPRLEH